MKSILLLCLLSFKPVPGAVFIRKELLPCEAQFSGAQKTTANLTSCDRKLFLSLKIIQDEQGQDQHQFVIVDTVFDVKLQEDVRLLQPLVVKVIQQPVTLAYPLRYLFAANNKPYEVTINTKTSRTYTGCDPLAVYQPSCQTYEHLAPNRAQNGKAITQGFCCPCEPADANNRRENIVCDDRADTSREGMDPQGTTHCLKFDPVWYSLYSLNSPSFHHKVGIGIYSEDLKKVGRWKPIVDAAQFSMGTQNGQFQHEIFKASYVEITKISPEIKTPLDHERKVLLIPQPYISNADFIPPQAKQGPEQFLVVNKTMVDKTGNTCDKIGVSYGAFDRQPNRCHSVLNSCLENSIRDIWLQDMRRSSNGQKKESVLSAFGQLGIPSVIQEPNSNPLLLFNISYEYISHVYIDINADVIQTVSQVHGEIVEGISLSDATTTEMEIHVHNKGHVTTVFTTQITECSSFSEVNGKHTEAIGPFASATFLFKLKNSNHGSGTGIFYCKVELINANGRKVAERTISYQPLHRCFCIGQCSCKCTSESEWSKCEMMNRAEFVDTGISEGLPSRKINHEKDLDLTIKIIVIVLLLPLALGVLKCVSNLCRSFCDSFSNRGLYKDIRPPFKEHPLKQMCLDIWFFYYCPVQLSFIFCQRLIKTGSKEEGQEYEHRYLSTQNRDELFATTEEKKSVLNFGEEVRAGASGENHKLMLGRRSRSLSLVNISPATSTNVGSQNLRNENIYESGVPDKESVTEGITSYDDKESAKASSSTSVQNKKVIESEFRKQKVNLKSSENELPVQEITSLNQADEESTGNVSIDEKDVELMSAADVEVLNVLSRPERPVYFNYVMKSDYLHKSGDHFSLCGFLRKSGLYYKFYLGDRNTQIFWNKKGKVEPLKTPLPISTKDFVRVMTGYQALQKVTLEPRSPCLNCIL